MENMHTDIRMLRVNSFIQLVNRTVSPSVSPSVSQLSFMSAVSKLNNSFTDMTRSFIRFH